MSISHFKQIMLQRLLLSKIKDGPHETPNYSEESDAIPFVTIGDVSNGVINLKEVKNKISKKDYVEYLKKVTIKKFDLLFSKAATIGKVVLVDDPNFMIWSTFGVLRPNLNLVSPSYLKHYLSSDFFINAAISVSNNNTQNNLGMAVLSKMRISIPELPLQTAIANYLDHETARIDAEIKKEERRIELLEELLQATIFETVTKGLDKNAEMVDSGIDWIGKIPTGWEVKRVKDLLFQKSTKNIKNDGRPVTENILSVMKDIGVVNYKEKGNVGNKMSDDITGYKLVYPGNLVVNKMNVTIGSLGISREFGALSVVYLVYEAKSGVNIKFIEFLCKCKAWQKYQRTFATGILEIRESVDLLLFEGQSLPVPPYFEQDLIVSYLSKQSTKIKQAVIESERKIELLKELKQATIYEAVTGKTEIPSHFYPKE